MLTKRSVGLIGIFTSLFTLGLLLSSRVLLAAGCLVLLFLVIAMVFEPPSGISIKLKEISGNEFITNENIEVTFIISVSRGIGTVAFMQEIPAEFELVDGNNLKIFWKGFSKRTVFMSYKLRCMKEGSYTLPGINWESEHILGLRQGDTGVSSESINITVKSPVKSNMVRHIISSLRLKNLSKLGVASTDFRELRDYVLGDPVGAVNWKATASRISRGINWPLVTEFEADRKQSLMIFLDASQIMETGTDIISAFDYAKQVAQGMSYAFLTEGFRVGICIYNSDSQPLYPDLGKRQIYRISRQLATVTTSQGSNEGLTGAVQKCRRYLTKYEASSIIITKVNSTSIRPLMDGIKMIRGISINKRINPLVVKINVFGHETAPSMNLYEDNAGRIVNMLHKSLDDQLKSNRVTLINWNPYKENFITALSRAGRR